MLHDLAIVGAGPVGATLALALADSDLDIVVLDARARGDAPRADRSLALSHGARLILERLDVWAGLVATPDAATPITGIEISQAGGFGTVMLTASESGLPALGYVVSYRALQAALDAALTRANVAVRYRVTANSVGGTSAYAAVQCDGGDGEPILARLAAVADGTGTVVAGVPRQRYEYRQVAVLAKLWRAKPHAGLAYERFTPDGPMALLPEGDHHGLVWTATPDRAGHLLALADAAFLDQLASRFGTRAAGFIRVADRRSIPLVLEFARDPTSTRCVVLGNAAQTLHPVAGQGFNLGLRDAYELAQAVLDVPREEIGGAAMLSGYARGRQSDRWAGIAFTHGLVNVFGNDLPLLRWSRGLALTMFDALPLAKRAFMHAMLFGAR